MRKKPTIEVGHEVTIYNGPCDEYRHVGQPCRVHWFTCSCMSGQRLAHGLAKRHDADDAKALEWSYSSAREHLATPPVTETPERSKP